MLDTRWLCITAAVTMMGLLVACDGPTNTPPPADIDTGAETDSGDQDPPAYDTSAGPYRLNLEGVPIPDRPAGGEIGGAPFEVAHAIYTVETGTLRLASHDGQELIIFVLLDDAAKPQGESINIEVPAFSVGDANIHMTYLDNGEPMNHLITTGFVLKLEFDDEMTPPSMNRAPDEDEATDPQAESPDDGDAPATTQPDDADAPNLPDASDTSDTPTFSGDGATPELVLPGRVYVCLPDPHQSYVAGEFEAAVEP